MCGFGFFCELFPNFCFYLSVMTKTSVGGVWIQVVYRHADHGAASLPPSVLNTSLAIYVCSSHPINMSLSGQTELPTEPHIYRIKNLFSAPHFMGETWGKLLPPQIQLIEVQVEVVLSAEQQQQPQQRILGNTRARVRSNTFSDSIH